jgi:hypothetical protein
MPIAPHPIVAEAKIQANLFYKAIKRYLAIPKQKQALVLAHRLKKLPPWQATSLPAIIAAFPTVKLKTCLQLMALERGYLSWQAMSQQLLPQPETRLYKYGFGSTLNVWYATYKEAKQHLEQAQTHYLLVYKQHYFICQADHILGLGLDPHDPDWQKIGRDWACPKDLKAHARLCSKLPQ